MGEAMIVVGGVIPEQDFAPLRDAGVDAIFPPGTVIAEAAQSLIERLNETAGLQPARERIAACGSTTRLADDPPAPREFQY